MPKLPPPLTRAALRTSAAQFATRQVSSHPNNRPPEQSLARQESARSTISFPPPQHSPRQKLPVPSLSSRAETKPNSRQCPRKTNYPPSQTVPRKRAIRHSSARMPTTQQAGHKTTAG